MIQSTRYTSGRVGYSKLSLGLLLVSLLATVLYQVSGVSAQGTPIVDCFELYAHELRSDDDGWLIQAHLRATQPALIADLLTDGGITDEDRGDLKARFSANWVTPKDVATTANEAMLKIVKVDPVDVREVNLVFDLHRDARIVENPSVADKESRRWGGFLWDEVLASLLSGPEQVPSTNVMSTYACNGFPAGTLLGKGETNPAVVYELSNSALKCATDGDGLPMRSFPGWPSRMQPDTLRFDVVFRLFPSDSQVLQYGESNRADLNRLASEIVSRYGPGLSSKDHVVVLLLSREGITSQWNTPQALTDEVHRLNNQIHVQYLSMENPDRQGLAHIRRELQVGSFFRVSIHSSLTIDSQNAEEAQLAIGLRDSQCSVVMVPLQPVLDKRVSVIPGAITSTVRVLFVVLISALGFAAGLICFRQDRFSLRTLLAEKFSFPNEEDTWFDDDFIEEGQP